MMFSSVLLAKTTVGNNSNNMIVNQMIRGGGRRIGARRSLWAKSQERNPPQQHRFRLHRALVVPSSRQISTTTARTTITRQQSQRHQYNRSKSTSSSSNNAAAESAAAAAAEASKEVVKEPSFKVLRLVALTQAIPFVGFGFMDNAILIIAGDAIDTSLGVMLGISTLCAAAIGNIISDLAGIGLGTVIEDFCAKYLNLPVPNLTHAQRQLRSVRFAGQLGMAVGMTFGCVVGMFPLLFLDTDKIARLKQKMKLEALFRDVVTEAKTLVGAESTVLYLRVDKEKLKDHKDAGMPYKPNVEGESIYAMFYDVPKKSDHAQEGSRVLPLGKGIVGRAMLTGQTVNITNVHNEPDFLMPMESNEDDAYHMKEFLVVPILDGQGRTIGAIRALNKVSDGSTADDSSEDDKTARRDHQDVGHFTDDDVMILKALATHISVSVQSLYQDLTDEDARLRDTIRILKEHRTEVFKERSDRRKTIDFGGGKSKPLQMTKRGSLFPEN